MREAMRACRPWGHAGHGVAIFALAKKSHGVRLAIFALTQGKMMGTGWSTTAGPPMTAASSAAIPLSKKCCPKARARPQQRLGLVDIIMAVCREYEVEEQEIKAPGKYRNFSAAWGVAAWLILETSGTTLAELSGYTGRDASTLSAATKALQLRAKSEQGLTGRMQELLANFY
jgi:hypothetical protein